MKNKCQVKGCAKKATIIKNVKINVGFASIPMRYHLCKKHARNY
jgi:hypothetical protein